MSARVRRISAALLALTLLVGVATPAAAVTTPNANQTEVRDSVSPTVDALVLRPVTFLSLVIGSGLFLVASPFMLVTRPQDIGKPFDSLVVEPAKYIWSDPLGTH